MKKFFLIIILLINVGFSQENPTKFPYGIEADSINAPINKGAFTGVLSLDKIGTTYYNDYDLSVSGTIEFNVSGENQINFSTDYVKIIADGLTPFGTSGNLNSIFTERPSGLPVDYILDAGEYGLYVWKTPNGYGYSLKAISTLQDPAPFSEDYLVYFNTLLDDPTVDGSNNVLSVVNRVDEDNPLINETGSNYATWNAVDRTIDFDASGERLIFDDAFANLGDNTWIIMAEYDNQSTTTVLSMSKYDASSDFDYEVRFLGRDIYFFDLNPTGSLANQYDTNSGRDSDSFVGKCFIIVTNDSVNGVAKAYYWNENYTGTKEWTLTPTATVSRAINRLQLRSGPGIYKVQAIAVANTWYNDADVNTIYSYFSQFLEY